jgi:hypothetical protein
MFYGYTGKQMIHFSPCLTLFLVIFIDFYVGLHAGSVIADLPGGVAQADVEMDGIVANPDIMLPIKTKQ